MASLKFYLYDALVNSWQKMDEATTGAATTAGWIVSTGTTNRSEWQSGTGSATERVATTFDAVTYPDGSLNASIFDAFRSTNAYTGDFSSANWTVVGAMRAVTNGGSQTGVLYCRLFKADSDGSNITEITSAAQASATSGTIGTAADTEVTITFNPGAWSISNQYIFLQIAWGRVAAGGMTSADVHFRTGSATTTGTRITTSTFVTTADAASAGTSAVDAAGVAITQTVASSDGVATVSGVGEAGSVLRILPIEQPNPVMRVLAVVPLHFRPQASQTVIVEADASSTGSATVTAAGVALWDVVGASVGQGTVLAEAVALWDAVGASIGTATLSADGTALWDSVASSDGVATVLGVGEDGAAPASVRVSRRTKYWMRSAS